MWLHRVLRAIAGPIFKWRYRLSSENQELAVNLKPPYIVVPNHVMTFDPAVVNYFVPLPIHFVASDANFRNPLTSFLLRLLGTIATSKLADDLASLRFMLRVLKEGKVIGLFAEGQRTWDGVTLPIIPSTAKLVKIAKVPVLVSLIKGGYMSIPRWSFHARRGRVVVEHKLAVTAEEAASLSTGEIGAKIEEALAHDDSEYQNERRVPYVSRRAAESLQLALFYCPACEALNTMYSEGRRFFCRSCGYEVEFTPFYRFRQPRGAAESSEGVGFRTVREWSVAQNVFIESLLSRAIQSDKQTELFADDGAHLFTGYRLARLRERGSGRLSFHTDGLRYEPRDGATGKWTQPRFFPWYQVKALNIVYQDQLEFYYGKTLYVFRFPAHDTSAYKYELCSRILAKLRGGS